VCGVRGRGTGAPWKKLLELASKLLDLKWVTLAWALSPLRHSKQSRSADRRSLNWANQAAVSCWRGQVTFKARALTGKSSSNKETLSNEDDDGSETITKRMNLSPFTLYRHYLEPLNSSNVGYFSWSWILKGFIHVQIEKGKIVVVCSCTP